MMSAFGNAWGQDLVEVAAPGTGQRVLDVACGTGAVARAAASRVGATGHVVGIDLNPAMLAMARAMAHDDGPPIEWREANATALPFADATFDLVCCHQGLQVLPGPLGSAARNAPGPGTRRAARTGRLAPPGAPTILRGIN